MKNIIKKIFSRFGIGIYRLNPVVVSAAPSHSVQSKNSPGDPSFSIQHNSLENVNRIFSDAVLMHDYLEPARLKFYDEVLQLTVSRGVDFKDKKIADVGCGTGHLLMSVKKISKPLSITGLDFSLEAVKFAKKVHSGGNFFVYSLYQKHNEKFDIVFCTEVIEHLLDPEIAVSNLKEMLGPDSACIITVPNGRLDTFEGHINFWSPESWSKFICEGFKGFEVETGLMSLGTVNYAIIKGVDR